MNIQSCRQTSADFSQKNSSVRRKSSIRGRFSNNVPVMKMPSKAFSIACQFGDQFYDLQNDPEEENNLAGTEEAKAYDEKLKQALCEACAPEEEYIRLGLA